MDTLEQSCNLIRNHLKSLDNQLRDLKKETVPSIRKSKIRSFRSEIESARNQINIFEIDLCSATDKQRTVYDRQKDGFAAEVDQLEAEVKRLEAEDAGKGGAPGGLIDEQTRQRNAPKALEDYERQGLVMAVDDRLKDAHADLDDIIAELMKGKNILQEVSEETRRQQEKLKKAHEEIQETYSLTKRSKKLITYFKRQIMTDKLLCSFIILIIIAIIVIIVLKAVGFKSDSFNSDVLPNSSINMTGGNNSTATNATKAR